jgi:hypothetical protein
MESMEANFNSSVLKVFVPRWKPVEKDKAKAKIAIKSSR